jgi:DNA-directed RNA polymerase subunit RPC12/RpoP
MHSVGPDASKQTVLRIVRTLISCTTCGRTFSFEEGEDLAVKIGIADQAVRCPRCSSIFEVDITSEGISIAADVTSKYGLQAQLPKAVSDEIVGGREPNTLKLMIVEFLALGFALGATQMGGGVPMIVIGCVAILMALFGLYVWRRM